MDIVACPSSPMLAKRIAEIKNLKLAGVEYKKFPDGELYARIESKENEHAVVGSINSNDDLVTFILALEALNGKKIAVIPYAGYARQDKVFLQGEAVSIRAVAKIIESYAEKVITVNIHSSDAASHFRSLVNLDAMPLIGKYYRSRDVIMLSPDKGSLERVKVAASVANCDWDYLEKRRIDASRVEIAPKNIDVEGKNVVIVDDIISTGGTVLEAAKQIFGLGAKKIEVACVHAVLASFAAVKILSSGISDIIATDTVEKVFSRISVAEIISANL
ncbi:MAG: ribose-phosphate diphosphokinase [Archaeoglobales archaeon]|nr:ribose-phosphate diphosphokinase [Archaeoglobales archaeon]